MPLNKDIKAKQTKFIWPIHRTLTAITTQGQNEKGIMAIKGFPALPRSPDLDALLKYRSNQDEKILA